MELRRKLFFGAILPRHLEKQLAYCACVCGAILPSVVGKGDSNHVPQLVCGSCLCASPPFLSEDGTFFSNTDISLEFRHDLPRSAGMSLRASIISMEDAKIVAFVFFFLSSGAINEGECDNLCVFNTDVELTGIPAPRREVRSVL